MDPFLLFLGISFGAALGCHVTLTDLPHVLPNLHYNAALNLKTLSSHGGEVRVAALSWGDEKEMDLIGQDYDLIVGSDVVYCEDLFDPLFRTLKYLMFGRSANKSVVFVMGHLKRWKKENSFFRKAKKVFDVKDIPMSLVMDGDLASLCTPFGQRQRQVSLNVKSYGWVENLLSCCLELF